MEAHSTSQFEVLSNWLQQESKPEAVLIWPKPTGFIADCLAREEPIDGSLAQWKDMAKRLLKLFRRHRSQLTLLGMTPGETLTLSDDELPDNITDVILQAEAAVKRLPEATPLYRLAAAQLVAEDAELQDELAFLSASSHACSSSTEQTSETVRSALQSAKESHHAKQQLKVLTNERDRAMEENKLLLTQLNSVQKALEVAQHQANNAASSQQTEQQLRKMIDERDSAQEENELLLTQLHIVQEALEEAYIELKSGIGESEGKRLKGTMTWLRAHARRQSAAVYKGRDNQALKELVDLLEQSELFDADWYLTQYKDIAEANINPAEHFIKFGAIEGRNPGPRFNTEFYVVTYPDVAASGHHPLLHYLRDGINEQRKTQESPT
ncbi:hypothetical protein K7H09_22130 [Halomonas sp. IOP_14]|uniref:hypothetical protein n=1 Tax=Halomonas sp. IOP_14 TaxID=2873295 RepID=UPI001E4E6537|nr:hypothetical protein [Halomonas sp. IOP_14]MCD1588708.1 hypothetical protein [Halomonas sp. IOP_14]